MSSRVRPSWTIANATSGWIPTMTVCAPRSRIMCAIARSVRTAKESITSRTVTSMMTPQERCFPTSRARSSRSWSSSSSLSADWMEAMTYWLCLRMGTRIGPSALGLHLARLRLRHGHRVSEQPLRLLDPALEIADGVDLAQVDADGDERLRDLGREPRHDDVGSHEARGVHRLHQVVGHGRVHGRHARDVHHHHLRAVGADAAQQLLGELARSQGVDDADDGQDEQSVADLQHGG